MNSCVSSVMTLKRSGPSHAAKKLAFFGVNAGLAEPQAFATFLAPLKRCEWVVYSKKSFGGPEAALAYPSRYTHRVAISNRRLVAADAAKVSFKYKDYRRGWIRDSRTARCQPYFLPA